MSVSDQTQQTSATSDQPRAVAEADMRDLLRQLAVQIKGQIADVDRRHSDAMRDIEARLQPGQPNPGARARSPDRAAFAPEHASQDEAVEPWDEANAELLTRIYETDAPQARAGRPAGPTPAVFFADPPVAVAKPRAAVAASSVPASAVPSKPIAAPAAPLRRPLETVQSIQKPAAKSAPTQLTSVAAAGPAPAAELLSTLASDRAWLDARLTDIAARVDQSLATFDPTAHLAPITNRIDALESHIEAALVGVVRKPDLARFAGLEKEVLAVKHQVEAARDQLKRLDGMETQLRDLSAFAAAAQDAPVGESMTYAAPDFAALAKAAADQVSDRFERMTLAQTAVPSASAPTASADSLQDMHKLLDTYVQEHRREKSENASALNTMQEALIRLIDRIEELAGDGSADEPSEVAEAPRFVEVQDERAPVPGRRQSDLAPAAELTQPLARPASPVRPEAAADVRVPRRPSVATAATPIEDPAAAIHAMAAERARVMAERTAAGSQPAQRRPASRPAPQSVEPEVAAVVEDAPKVSARRMAKPAASSSNVKRGLMVAGLGVVLIGSGFATNYLLANHMSAETKQVDRITPQLPANPNKSVVARPPAGTQSVPTELVGRPTPALPEAQPTEPKPQPAVQRQPLPGAPQPVQTPRDAPLPTPAPAARPIDTPPAGAPRVRSVPETVTDDLSSNTQPPDAANRPNFAEAMGARISHAAVHGIALDTTGSMPDPSELARRQTRMAPPQPVPMAKPISASTAGNEPPLDPLLSEGNSRTRVVEIPPASIGPLSLRMAAQKGDPAAAFEVALRFAEAKGVKQDFPQALAWYTRAAQGGFVPAQYRLATLYERGLGADADLPRAKAWYKRAADQGNVKAMHNLAVLSAGPQQDNPDYATAAKWFGEAADRGLADSQFNLGVLHENGLGVAKDPQQAYKWFALAARSGDKESTRRRDQMLASFAPTAAQAAANMVENWRAKPTDLKANDPRAAGQALQSQRDQMQAIAEQQMLQAQERQQLRQQKSAEAPAGAPATSVEGPVAKTVKAVIKSAPLAP